MKNAFGPVFRAFAWMALGATIVLSVPALVGQGAGAEAPVMWWVARALGLLAYVALWLSMLFGVLVAARGAGGLLDRATLTWLHNRWALAGLGATTLHVLAVVGDPHSGVSPLAAALPMMSDTLTGAVTLGTLACWGLVGIALTTHFISRIPSWVWRAVHAGAFGSFVLALAHAASAGSESGLPLVRALYVSTSAVLVAAIVQRILLARRGRAPLQGVKS